MCGLDCIELYIKLLQPSPTNCEVVEQVRVWELLGASLSSGAAAMFFCFAGDVAGRLPRLTLDSLKSAVRCGFPLYQQ
ncbi:MAG: hypothetical protein LBF08_04605 [Dysgonamonadaceae bacterium]|nr:hypothetical protein [Dysgonamonadaceae bacterium]